MKEPDQRLKPAEKKDMELAQKIKPKLKKFVIDLQKKKAEETVKEKLKQEKEMDNDALLKHCWYLSNLAYLKKQLWRVSPLPMESKWLKVGVSSSEMQKEMNVDLGGFAAYLTSEYVANYLKLRYRSKRGYPNPLMEENLEWFWAKFVSDLKLLFKAERLRQAKGNQGVITVPKVTDEQLDIIKTK